MNFERQGWRSGLGLGKSASEEQKGLLNDLMVNDANDANYVGCSRVDSAAIRMKRIVVRAKAFTWFSCGSAPKARVERRQWETRREAKRRSVSCSKLVTL